MNDIAPLLLSNIQKDFQNHFDKSEIISKLYAKVRDGTATYAEANEFAIETGNILADVFQKNISSSILPNGKFYYNIANRILTSTMKNNYNLISAVTQQVQKSLNESAGIGLKAIAPELNENRIQGIVNKVSEAEFFDDVAWVLDEPIKNFSQSIVDDSIRTNAEFQYQSGMTPKIIRKSTGKCCEWCSKIAGIHNYEDVRNTGNNVFRRHQRCRCTVEYYPGDGKKQDVWSKKVSNIKRISNVIDHMGKSKIHQVNLGKHEYAVKVYENDGYDNIECQTYTKNSQDMCRYLDEKINKAETYGQLDNIIVAKHKTLQGIAAYEHQSNSLYISEELIDSKQFSQIVDSDFFVAKNLDEILIHELGGHKKHWEAIEKYRRNKACKSTTEAKIELEANLREYVTRQISMEPLYLKRIIGENAFAQFRYKNVLNECIADAIILIRRGELSDKYLEKLIEEVIHYDDSTK